MFFSSEMQNFTTFSLPHNVTFLLFLVLCFGFIYFSNKLKSYQSLIKWTLFTILIICEITLHTWLIVTGIWEMDDLPLHLCSFSTYLAFFLFFKKNQNAFNLLYFIGTIPAMLSMLTPDLEQQFPHFHFFEYFLHHSAIPLSVLYFILFENYRVPKRAIMTSFLILNIIAVPIFILNQLLDTNFFYLASPTEQETLLSYFGSGIWYYINLEIVGILVFVITYWPMGRLMRREGKKA